MDVLDAIREWEEFNRQIVYEIRESKSSEYKLGYADGLESALESLKASLEEVK